MSGRWYKRYGGDFIHGTMMLTLEEKGAYSLCLDLIYDRAGAIPDDARWLAGVCGVSIRKWNAIRARLIDLNKLRAENGLISNFRADFELVSSGLQARKFAESGSKGGRKRAENAASLNGNKDLAQASLKPPFKQTRLEEIRVEKEEQPKGCLSAEPTTSAVTIDEVVGAWNETASRLSLPLVKVLSDERKQKVKARIRDHPIEDFQTALASLGRSKFLCGESKGGWKADFDFFVQKSTFIKLLEGSYDH